MCSKLIQGKLLNNIGKYFTGIFFIIISIVFSLIFIDIAGSRKLTELENILFQSISLLLGMVGAVLIGRESSKEAAKEFIKPPARSAFRRVVSLYRGLSKLMEDMQIEIQNNPNNNLESHLGKYIFYIERLINTADFALEDWRDIIPEDVEELLTRYKLIEQK